MAKYSAKMMGKEVGDAGVYAEPHTMKGAKYNMNEAGKLKRDPNLLTAREMNVREGVGRVSAGDPARDDVKRDGIKVRGTGAATKGLMARGPMA